MDSSVDVSSGGVGASSLVLAITTTRVHLDKGQSSRPDEDLFVCKETTPHWATDPWGRGGALPFWAVDVTWNRDVPFV